MVQAIIYDFDGVIADSEALANQVLAECVTELGRPTTVQDSYRLCMGKRFADVLAAIAETTGRELPPGFAKDYQARTLMRFRRELQPVPGAAGFIAAFADMARAIASSSSPDRLALSLEVLGMGELFEGRVFSASMVARGKPAPDIFLHAAREIGVAPARCAVIEDSASGVTAARAAGMRVIGLLAGSHIGHGHGERLAAAGAERVAQDFAEAERVVRAWRGA